MENKVISSGDLMNFVKGIIDSGIETYGVQQKDQTFGKFKYDVLKNADALRLDYDVTLTPPKKFFSPEKEVLLKYELSPEIKTNSVYDTNRRVLIGVHPYDMVAINQMDVIWKDKYEDVHYIKRRKNTIIIGVDPQKATSWSFWCMMEASTVDKGYDIWLTKLDDDTYFMEVSTEKGKELADKYAKTENATDDHVTKRDSVRANLHKVCNPDRKLSAKPGEIPLLVKENWDHPVWKAKAEKCYSCGSCNVICPTCYCFDVKDEIELNMKNGKKMRVWDGCQLENFAIVATGENFREHRVDRYKHRFYRKTVYQYERYDQLACVGCGRCSSVCLPNIADPVDIINKIKEEK